MNQLKNSVRLIGNVGKAPEIKLLESGTKLARFSVVINEKYKDKNGTPVEQANWFNLSAWKNSADFVEKFVKKGEKVAIEGFLKTSEYMKDGIKHYSTDVHVNEIMLLNSKSKVVAETQTEDDLPF
ncbi:MAG: single-stranded DNA-binding protein [Bacteroidia bacterium]|nr:single-stranded DNA-binding protein [Bacteroidia bacterium]